MYMDSDMYMNSLMCLLIGKNCLAKIAKNRNNCVSNISIVVE